MNDIHSKVFKKKYLKSKIKLKQWENEFLAENGRLPTKVDIKNSPAVIKEYYKLYWKLKTQILESEILGEDKLSGETASLSRSVSDSHILKVNKNLIEDSKKDEEDTQKCLASAYKEVPGTVHSESSKYETWGPHLNRVQATSVTEKEKCTLLNETIVGRLFKGSSFKKRNPRKSLSLLKKKSNKSVNSEEIKSIDSPDIGSIMSPFSDCQNDVVDQSLNGSVFSVENDCSPNIKALIASSASLSPLLNSLEERKVLEDKVTSAEPVSLIQVVASDPSVVLKPSRSLDAGWVERCIKMDSKKERKSSDSGFESMEYSQVLEESQVDDLSEDDLIIESDNETNDVGRLNRNFMSQKRKPEFSPTERTIRKEGSVLADVQNACKKLKMNSFAEEAKENTKEEIKKAILERKIQTGKLNENFVRINLKKKVFVRGKKNFNFARYKKKEWKNKKKNLEEGKESGGIVQCYKCGESGHFSRNCQKNHEDTLLEMDEHEDDTLPTLEEAEKMAKEKAKENHFRKKNFLTVEKPQEEDNSLPKVEPYYSLKEDGTLLETPSEVFDALHEFGHTQFRPGQEDSIMRILSGQSTLLTIATGGGKSLCYQLPAYLYAKRSKCITLVVSPLVSLMEDQVSGSSAFFKVGCLHTSQTQKQRETVIQEAKSGKLYALLVSPEAVVSGDFSGLGSTFRQLPPIAFACIDEVHCISQWSHNFRPSYLMISRVLKEKFGITTILGLTATASLSTIKSISAELGINEREGVIKDIPIPDNLCLSVSRDENKDEALISLLKSSKFKDASAILIYCTRRDECERLAVYIRTRLQDASIENGKFSRSSSWNAESYHAGMAAARRRQVQKAFMRGNLRIVVATVAFGMGINKQDIRGVIHYNMPKDFESYVQEVGRAGRDGMLAYCHLFLDSKGCDLNELRRHVHSNSVDRHVLRKLLQRVFSECDCKAKEKLCEGHEIAFDCQGTVQTLDIPEENIHTLLCYLELNEKRFIKVLAPVYINCKVKSYKGMKEIISVAKNCPPLAYALALKSKKDKSEILTFDVIKVANKLDWDSALVKNELKKLEWGMTKDGKWKKSGVAVEFHELGFRVCSRGDMTPSELDEALDYLIQRVESQEKRANAQLDVTFSTFDFFAKNDYSCCVDDFDDCSSQNLKRAVQTYFETEELCSEIPLKQLKVEVFDEEAVAADIRTLICTYRDNTFNGRAVARIFHGIQSPNYPASFWYKCKFWRKHIDKDFNKISRLATIEILRLKT